MDTLGNRLKELREEKGFTLEYVAIKLNTTKTSISRYEKDEREPKSEMLTALANFYAVSTDYLLCRTNIRNSQSNISDNTEKNVEEILENTMNELLSQDGLMLNGEILDDNDLMLLRKAIQTGIEYAKSMKTKK